MKPLAQITAALMLLTTATGFMVATATPSMADEPSCKTVIIGIGLGCAKSQSSSSPTATPTNTAAPVSPAPQATTSPVQTPEPQTTVVVKETILAAPPVTTPDPVRTTQAAIVIPVPTVAPSATGASPSINSEHASENNKSPELGEQVSQAAPYIFFVSLAFLVALLITARVRKLFPFEGKIKATEK